jgi:formamidase
LRHNVASEFSGTTQRCNDVHIAHRQDCLNAIEYLTEFGYLKAQA